MSRPAPHAWHDEDIARLRVMWAAGLSLNQIGVALGISRNAVAGKALLLKLERRGSPLGPQKRTEEIVAQVRDLVAAGKSLTSIAKDVGASRETVTRWSRDRDPSKIRHYDATGPGEGVGMADITRHQCAWPLWGNERPTFRCCGAPIAPGRPYCAAHAKRAYSKQYSVPAREWTITEIDRCTGLYLQGMPVPKIAALIGRSSTEIADKMRALSVRFGSGRSPRRAA